MDKKFDSGKKRSLKARYEAQKIAFAPVVFQAVRLLRDLNILKVIEAAGKTGLKVEDIAEQTGVSSYGVTVLCETGLSQDVLEMKDDCYIITRVGHFLLNDELTKVNMDFVHDVCYEGLFRLDQAIETGKPSGLEVFGQWPTIYEALRHLPAKAKQSWFAFDHFYSDTAFPNALPHVFDLKPKSILDIGANTGKFAIQSVLYDPDVHVTMMDLPGQLAKAKENIAAQGVADRISPYPVCDLLDPKFAFPGGFDAVWMSQFLVCFSEDQILSLLERGKDALAPQGSLFILDTYWDRQQFEIAAYCLINSSPYFTAMANGNSRMYRFSKIEELILRAGLYIESVDDGLGIGHTLIRCRANDK
ncbi:class I SAM-dependent methyltransferase [uncultured Desulfobacter sp.]|uniref:SAM-dependent methyltransferase n=1 Tax=uncultured Desulfobacter sp. TaxID=240139 RepID=UPI0029F5BD5B|nr:class I SAM-dependent methyltransferase [uncultured Desulfobacter sp.]